MLLPSEAASVTYPIDCGFCALRVVDLAATAILRTWDPGDTADCRLCPREHCNGRGRDFCMVMVNETEPEERTASASRGPSAWRPTMSHDRFVRGGDASGILPFRCPDPRSRRRLITREMLLEAIGRKAEFVVEIDDGLLQIWRVPERRA